MLIMLNSLNGLQVLPILLIKSNMRRIYHRLRVFFILSLISSLSLSATDLLVKEITPPYTLDIFEGYGKYILGVPPEGAYSPIRAVIENANVLSALFFTVHFTILDLHNDTIFKDVVTGINLPPFTSDTFYSKNWELKEIKGVDIIVEVKFLDDIDLSNNEKVIQGIAMKSQFQSTEDVKITITENRTDLKDENGNIKVPGYSPPEPLMPGTVVSYRQPENDTVRRDTIRFFSWLFYIPHFISDFYPQPADVVIANAEDGSLTTTSTNYPPLIDGVPYLFGSWEKLDSEDQVFGPEPKADTAQDVETVHQEKTTTPARKDSVCAILVSGNSYSGSESRAFYLNREFMQNNLMLEEFGPKLEESQIINREYMSPSELQSIFASVKGKCDILYFYYTGHGYNGGMDLVGSSMDYAELVAALYATGAKEVRVIIEACHSGSAEGAFRDSDFFVDRSLTLITSSNSPKYSYTKNIVTTQDGTRYNPGFFTMNFLKCFGDPQADRDGDGQTSLQEAYDCLREMNPMLINGRMNAVQDPQIIRHRVYRAEDDQKTVMVPEHDIKLQFRDPLDQDAFVRVNEVLNLVDKSTDDETIIGFATHRFFNINIANQTGDFSVDIEFTINPEKDSLPETGGEVGMVKRDSSGSKWEKVESNFDPETNKLTVRDIAGFSDFAFALFAHETTAVADPYAGSETFLLYPVPAKEVLFIEFTLDKDGPVDIEIFDLSGRKYFHDRFGGNSGLNRLKLDPDNLEITSKTGIYVIKLRSADRVLRKQFLIE